MYTVKCYHISIGSQVVFGNDYWLSLIICNLFRDEVSCRHQNRMVQIMEGTDDHWMVCSLYASSMSLSISRRLIAGDCVQNTMQSLVDYSLRLNGEPN